jgi:hypothetical protein
VAPQRFKVTKIYVGANLFAQKAKGERQHQWHAIKFANTEHFIKQNLKVFLRG